MLVGKEVLVYSPLATIKMKELEDKIKSIEEKYREITARRQPFSPELYLQFLDEIEPIRHELQMLRMTNKPIAVRVLTEPNIILGIK